MLANALPYTPPGVHLAVVDPGVGIAAARGRGPRRRRRARPGRARQRPARRRRRSALGGAVEAVDVSLSGFRLEPVSATFHGRDVFAPVSAHLAVGRDARRRGRADRPGDARSRCEVSRAEIARAAGSSRTSLYVDRLRQRRPRPRAPSGCRRRALRLGRAVRVETAQAGLDAVYSRDLRRRRRRRA